MQLFISALSKTDSRPGIVPINGSRVPWVSQTPPVLELFLKMADDETDASLSRCRTLVLKVTTRSHDDADAAENPAVEAIRALASIIEDGSIRAHITSDVDGPKAPADMKPSPDVHTDPSAAGLSPRELEILEFVMKGDSNKHIARRLAIAEPTVKSHIKSILRKIHARNRFEAAMWAMRMKSL